MTDIRAALAELVDSRQALISAIDNAMAEHNFRRMDAAWDAARAALVAQPADEDYSHTPEYWQGHDEACSGVARRWAEALESPIPKPGVMNEPFESLYRRTEALRLAEQPAQDRLSKAVAQQLQSYVDDPVFNDDDGQKTTLRNAIQLLSLAEQTAQAPLQADVDKPWAVFVPEYGYVDVKAVRAVERAHGIKP